jgi:hypothetical protein
MNRVVLALEGAEPVRMHDQSTRLQRIHATRFGFGSDASQPDHQYAHYYAPNDPYKGYKVAAPGHAAMKCPGMAVTRDLQTCNTEVTGRAPNMWDPKHRIYTVWRLKEDRMEQTFKHTCVDAEFPHFPYAHYVAFSALRPTHPCSW